MKKIVFSAVWTLFILFGAIQLSHCQNPPGNQIVGPFTGIHDADSSVTIGDSEAQTANDVRLTKDGKGLKTREGIALNATLTTSTGPVVGAHFFKAAGGTAVRLVAQDIYVDASLGGAAFSHIISTMPATISYYDFADSQGSVWGLSSSNTELFSYNGSAVTWYPSLPKGTQVEASPDRLIISGTSANPNRINYSQSGTFTNFTAGINAGDAYTDDIGIAGDKITAIKYALGRLVYWTSGGMGACQGTGQFDSVCYDISKTVGTVEPASVVYAEGGIYFLAQDKHFYVYDGNTLTKLTRALGSFLSGLRSSTAGSNRQTTQADFVAGTQSPSGSWSTAITPNSIVPSTWTATDTLAADFGAGTLVNISSTMVSGDLTFQYLADNFTDGDLTANPKWNISYGGYCDSYITIESGRMKVDHPASTARCVATSTSTAYYGTWSWDYVEDSQNAKNGAVAFIGDNGDAGGCSYGLTYNHSATAFTITLGRTATQVGFTQTGFATTIGTAFNAGVPNGAAHSYSINRTEAGAFTVSRDGTSIITGTDNTCSNALAQKFAVINEQSTTLVVRIDNIVTPSTGSFQSQEFNTAFSTPVWGALMATATISGSSTLSFGTRVAATSGGTKDAYVSVANGSQIASASKKYVTYIASAAASAADAPVVISAVGLNAATTGQFMGSCITGNTVSSFGVLSCAITTTGGGAATLFSRSGASCPLSSSWGAQTNNANLSASANEAFQWRIDSTLTHATDTVRVDQCSLAWIEAAVAATFGAYFNDDIYWSVVYSSGLKQNRVLHYSPAYGSWFPWRLRVSAMSTDDTPSLYMGASDSGHYFKFGGVDTDTGTAITGDWTSKDFSLGDPTIEKSIDRISVMMKNQLSGSLSLDYVVNGTSTTTKSLSMVGTSGNPMVLRNFNTGLGTKGNLFRVRPYGSAPWEIYGIKFDFQTLPWRIQ